MSSLLSFMNSFNQHSTHTWWLLLSPKYLFLYIFFDFFQFIIFSLRIKLWSRLTKVVLFVLNLWFKNICLSLRRKQNFAVVENWCACILQLSLSALPASELDRNPVPPWIQNYFSSADKGKSKPAKQKHNVWDTLEHSVHWASLCRIIHAKEGSCWWRKKLALICSYCWWLLNPLQYWK